MSTSTWQRNPWVWLVIAIPTATVLGCLLTIYLAISNPHQIVDETPGPNPTAQAGQTDGGR